MTVPNVWGAGAVFAFSAFDGENSFSSPVGSLSADRVGVRFHLKPVRELAFCIPEGRGFSFQAVTGDTVLFTMEEKSLGFAFAEANLVVGKGLETALVKVFSEGAVKEEASESFCLQEADGEWTGLAWRGDRFAFAFASTREETLALCQKGLQADFEALVKKRLSFFGIKVSDRGRLQE